MSARYATDEEERKIRESRNRRYDNDVWRMHSKFDEDKSTSNKIYHKEFNTLKIPMRTVMNLDDGYVNYSYLHKSWIMTAVEAKATNGAIIIVTTLLSLTILMLGAG